MTAIAILTVRLITIKKKIFETKGDQQYKQEQNRYSHSRTQINFPQFFLNKLRCIIAGMNLDIPPEEVTGYHPYMLSLPCSMPTDWPFPPPRQTDR